MSIPRRKNSNEINQQYLIDRVVEWLRSHPDDLDIIYGVRAANDIFSGPQHVFMQPGGVYEQIMAKDPDVIISGTAAVQAFEDALKILEPEND